MAQGPAKTSFTKVHLGDQDHAFFRICGYLEGQEDECNEVCADCYPAEACIRHVVSPQGSGSTGYSFDLGIAALPGQEAVSH